MSRTAEEVLEAAMALPEEERAKVAARLQESIRGFENLHDEDWDEELARRLKEIDDGEVELIPAEEVHDELRKKYDFFKG